MAKRRISKASKRRLVFFGTISLVIIFYFIFSSGFYMYKIHNLKLEEKRLTDELNRLQIEEKDLSKTQEKLKDPEYLAKYAREAYSYSKEGEIILQKYKEEEKEVKEEKFELNEKEKKIIIGCIVGFVLLILYILVKSKKNKR